MHPAEVTDLLEYRSSRQVERTVETISTGSLGLDLAMGGGWRKGRIVELYGDYSTYKTSVARHTVAQAQKHGMVLWIDPLGQFDRVAADNARVSLRNLAITRPDSALDTLQVIKDCASFMSLIVVDGSEALSIHSLANYGEEFGWMKSELATTTVLFVNALHSLRNPFTNEIQRWSSQRVKLSPASSPRQVKALVVKNSFLPPPIFPIRLQFQSDATIDAVWELVTLAAELEVLERRGSWYFYRGHNLGQGVDGAITGIGAAGLFGAIREQVIEASS